MDDADVLGCCLGQILIQGELSGEMGQQIKYELFKDDDEAEKIWNYPPILATYGLDG